MLRTMVGVSGIILEGLNLMPGTVFGGELLQLNFLLRK